MVTTSKIYTGMELVFMKSVFTNKVSAIICEKFPLTSNKNYNPWSDRFLKYRGCLGIPFLVIPL